MMAYKLPVEDVHPLSRAFFKLEAGKFRRGFEVAVYVDALKTLLVKNM